jgi:hypothetical protein
LAHYLDFPAPLFGLLSLVQSKHYIIGKLFCEYQDFGGRARPSAADLIYFSLSYPLFQVSLLVSSTITCLLFYTISEDSLRHFDKKIPSINLFIWLFNYIYCYFRFLASERLKTRMLSRVPIIISRKFIEE